MEQFYSQFGEDKWMAENMNLPSSSTFFDIGANDGITGSNTYFLEKRGWHGLCVDADPRCFELLTRIRKVSLQYVVTDKVDVNGVPFIMDHTTKDWSRVLGDGSTLNHLDNVTLCPSTTIRHLCIKYGINPFLVSIDVEGSEIDVIRGMDNIRPIVMVVEYLTQDVNRLEKLIDAIPDYVVVHTTQANIIVVLESHVDLVVKWN